MQDVFLDRVPWIQNSWPLNARDAIDVLAHHLARLRQSYVCELLSDCGHVAGMSKDHITAMVNKWLLASPVQGFHFARHIVETLREGLIYQQYTAETFSPEIIERRGAAVVKDYKKHLTLSRA
jgi:hypothetical protein